MAKPIPGGYLWRQTLTKARNADRAVREALRRLAEDEQLRPGQAILLVKAANALMENLEALDELSQILDHQKGD